MKLLIALAFILSFISSNIAQRNVADSVIGIPYCGIHYTAAMPGGDLADRYGYINQLGGFAGYKTSKNWIFGLDGNFIFGNRVKETGSILAPFVDANGNLTATGGNAGTILFFLRGFYANAVIGKIFPVLSTNPNSGIMVQLGAGYLWHRIRIETQEDLIPQFEDEYKKGYDRLTIGFNTSQFLGYNFMADRGVYNFYAGFYAQQGFTKNQRDIFWDIPQTPVSQNIRLDLQFGIRAGWLIPIYKRMPKDFYFN